MINFQKLKNFNLSSGIVLLLVSAFLLLDIRISEFSDISTGEGVVGPKTAPSFLNLGIAVLSLFLIYNGYFINNNNDQIEKLEWKLIIKKILLILITFLYLNLTNLIGYLLSTFLIIPIILMIFENKDLKKNILISFCGSLIYYVFFIKILGLHNPDPYFDFFNFVSF
jgi:hypothetical protein